MDEIKYLRKTMPLIPAGHPQFKWTSGADVQARWRSYGWVPPSELKPVPIFVEKAPEWVAVRRIK